MKNQYFADINDYRKYGLLRTLVGDGSLTAAVCWMLTEGDGRTDGQHVSYLDNPGKWGRYDPPLFDSLASCMADPANRSVEWAEAEGLIPSAVYFSELLADRRLERERYFQAFTTLAAGRDLVFFDPDNGIEVKSTPYGTRGSRKYIYWRELAETFNAGHSVLVYQHFNRIKRQTFIGQIVDGIRNCLDSPEVVTFSTPNVLFLLAVQPEHQSYLAEGCSRVAALWGSQIGVQRHRCALATPATSDGEEDSPPGQVVSKDYEG